MLYRPTIFEKVNEIKDELVDRFPLKDQIRQDIHRTRRNFNEQRVLWIKEFQETKYIIKEGVQNIGRRSLDSLEELNETTKDMVKEDFQAVVQRCQRVHQRISDEANLRKQIRSYEEYLRSAASSEAVEINQTICKALPSGSELKGYYQDRPEMKDLTLKTDLRRLKEFTVYTHEGKKITDPDQILEYEAGLRNEDGLSYQEVLWRAANQSLFADVICCLTSATGLIRPQLSSATFVDDCSVVIDLADELPHVRGECYLNVSIPSTTDDDEGRLSMAGVLVSVYFCPALSDLRARVLHISPATQSY